MRGSFERGTYASSLSMIERHSISANGIVRKTQRRGIQWTKHAGTKTVYSSLQQACHELCWPSRTARKEERFGIEANRGTAVEASMQYHI